jgi:hypothetical protein
MTAADFFATKVSAMPITADARLSTAADFFTAEFSSRAMYWYSLIFASHTLINSEASRSIHFDGFDKIK